MNNPLHYHPGLKALLDKNFQFDLTDGEKPSTFSEVAPYFQALSTDVRTMATAYNRGEFESSLRWQGGAEDAGLVFHHEVGICGILGSYLHFIYLDELIKDNSSEELPPTHHNHRNNRFAREVKDMLSDLLAATIDVWLEGNRSDDEQSSTYPIGGSDEYFHQSRPAGLYKGASFDKRMDLLDTFDKMLQAVLAQGAHYHISTDGTFMFVDDDEDKASDAQVRDFINMYKKVYGDVQA